VRLHASKHAQINVRALRIVRTLTFLGSMSNDAATSEITTTIDTARLRVYPGGQSQVAVAYPTGGPRYGVTVAIHTYADGPSAWRRWAEGPGWREAQAVPLTTEDLRAIDAAPRHYLCG